VLEEDNTLMILKLFHIPSMRTG